MDSGKLESKIFYKIIIPCTMTQNSSIVNRLNPKFIKSESASIRRKQKTFCPKVEEWYNNISQYYYY